MNHSTTRDRPGGSRCWHGGRRRCHGGQPPLSGRMDPPGHPLSEQRYPGDRTPGHLLRGDQAPGRARPLGGPTRPCSVRSPGGALV